MSRSTRRGFLKRTGLAVAAAVASPYIVPRNVLAQDGSTAAPNDKIIMAAIGTGSRSPADTRALAGFPDVEFAAVCDVALDRARQNAKRLGIDEKGVY